MKQTVPIGGVSIAPPIINGGSSTDASVNLEFETPVDTQFYLESSYPEVAWPIPSSVWVRGGSNVAEFRIESRFVTESITITVSGYSAGGVLTPADAAVLAPETPAPVPAGG